MPYIYIFARICDPGVIKFGFTGNVEKRIKQMNAPLYKDEEFYYCYCTYEVSKLVDKTLFHLIDGLNPNLRVSTDKEFYYLTEVKAYDILKSIAVISNTEDKLILYSMEQSEEEETIIDDTGDKALAKETIPKLGKKGAISLLRQNGHKLEGYVTYGSRNPSRKYYWVDSPKDILDKDWSMILEDSINGFVYLFNIPAGALQESDLYIRTDSKKPDYLTLRIKCDDDDFTDLAKSPHVKFSSFRPLIVKYDPSSIQTDNISYSTETDFRTNSTHSFSEKFSPINHTPISCNFFGNEIETPRFKDFVSNAILEFMNHSDAARKIINDLAAKDGIGSPLYGGKKIYLSKYPSNITEYHEEVGNTGIYYEASLSGDIAIKFVKWLAEQIHEDPSKLFYTIK